MSNLAEHLKTSEENRSREWDEKFFKLFSESNIRILSEDPQQGPDGWPYLMVETLTADETDEAGSLVDSSQKVMHWLSDKGIGLVVNPQRTPYPDYVFSYGMIWGFRETGLFIKYNALELGTQLNIEANSSIKTGPPSAEYLPPHVRRVLKDFLRDQSVNNARVLMISVDGQHYDLCFSLESLGSPAESEHAGILEALAWFMPPHYSLAIVSEKNIPGFESL